MKFNVDEVNRLMRERRSVFPKDYSGEHVPGNVIEQMLDNANWAPTHKLTEPWRFVVFSGEGLQKFASFQASCYERVARREGTFRPEKYDDLLRKPLLSSHIIAVGMKRDEKRSVPEIEEAGAVFCAVQNMYLTATAYGVGCYLSTGGITYYPEAKEFLGLGADDKLIGFLHVGMPKGALLAGNRRAVAGKVKWIT